MLFPYTEPAVQREIGSHTFDAILRVGYQRRQYDGNTRQRVTGSASLGDYSYLSGSEVVDARTAEYAASADYSLRPARWMSVQCI